MAKKRVLWLFNHTTLRAFEVPLLIDMGYEVYCPKICQIEYGDLSVSVSHDFDSSLTLPKGVIEKLNQTDFYTNLSADTMAVLNAYFDIVICIFGYQAIKSLLRHFTGQIMMHVFGLAGKASYTNLLIDACGVGIFADMKACGNRFWFAPAYEHLSEIECDYLQARTIFLPIALKNSIITHTWKGDDNRFLFVCPKIETNIYYNEIYKQFKKAFKEIPHVIGGSQLQPVEYDSTVCGFLSDEEYQYNMKNLACMFYHSTEIRHIHYHPFEAIKVGMPLVFMAGGLLDTIGGETLPGRCRTIEEAKKKIQRIVNGDKRLINKIVETQEVLLKPLTREFCEPYWEKGLAKVEDAIVQQSIVALQPKKLAVILPDAYLGGVLDFAKCFLLALQKGIVETKDSVELVFCYRESEDYNDHPLFDFLKKAGIRSRPITAKIIEHAQLKATLDLSRFSMFNTEVISKGTVIDDGASFLMDCDYHIYLTDRSGDFAPVFTLKPFAMVVHDYIQRYCKDVIDPRIATIVYENQRRADVLLCTSAATRQDCIASGIKKDKLIQIPYLFASVKGRKIDDNEVDSIKIEPKSYFLWSTNTGPHKNHIIALKALAKYYQDGGTLTCVVTGVNTQLMNPKKNYRKSHIII